MQQLNGILECRPKEGVLDASSLLQCTRAGGGLKKTSLERLISNPKPTVLMIQKTMMEGMKVEEIVNEIVKDWKMESMDADGHSGGILIAWSSVMN